MLRSAAKNHESVTVVCDPDDYGPVLAALDGEPAAAGGLPALRRRLALKVFQRTAAYDAAIARYLAAAEAGGARPGRARRISRHAGPVLAEGPGAALRGESAPARGALRHLSRAFPAAPGEGAQL